MYKLCCITIAVLIALISFTGCSQKLDDLFSSKTIGPEGGTITAGSGNVTLVVPPGAVLSPTVFSTEFSADAHTNLVFGTAYKISVFGVDSLINPAQLTIKYEPVNVTGYTSLTLYRKDDDDSWHQLTSTTDAEQHTVTASVSTLGTFAIIGGN